MEWSFKKFADDKDALTHLPQLRNTMRARWSDLKCKRNTKLQSSPGWREQLEVSSPVSCSGPHSLWDQGPQVFTHLKTYEDEVSKPLWMLLLLELTGGKLYILSHWNVCPSSWSGSYSVFSSDCFSRPLWPQTRSAAQFQRQAASREQSMSPISSTAVLLAPLTVEVQLLCKTLKHLGLTLCA